MPQPRMHPLFSTSHPNIPLLRREGPTNQPTFPFCGINSLVSFSTNTAKRLLFALTLTLLTLAHTHPTSADIYQWEWVDPADHSQGRQQSTTLAPDGAGRDAEAWEDLENLDLSSAWLNSKDMHHAYLRNSTLTNADFGYSDLSQAFFDNASLQQANFADANLSYSSLSNTNLESANFSGADLTYASLAEANLTFTNFTNAIVHGAYFASTTDSGFTANQLYSTASYQSGNLYRIRFRESDLAGWDFTGQDLRFASFYASNLANTNFSEAYLGSSSLKNTDLTGANLTDALLNSADLENANFTDAIIQGARFHRSTQNGFTAAQFYSTSSYQTGDLSGVKLDNCYLQGWDFSNKNLTNARFVDSDLRDADFRNAVIQGVRFYSTENFNHWLTDTQLYSTASYQEGNLTGVQLENTDMSGWNLSNINLTDSRYHHSNLTGATFNSTDTRNASSLTLIPNTPLTQNTIHPNGTLYGLNIPVTESMRLWDYDPETPLPIHVTNELTIDPTGTLKIVVEDDHWGSTLTFESGIPVNLDGTLELLVDPDETANITSLIGSTFSLFDWTGVTPAGGFAQITTAAGLVWDTSTLYTNGNVTLLEVPGYLFGDFNEDGLVDATDMLTLQANFGTTSGATPAQGDADADGDVNFIDQRILEARFGTPIYAAPGDLTGDGIFDGADFRKWQRHFGTLYTTDDYNAWQSALTTTSLASAATIPEPSTAILLLLALATIPRRHLQK